MNANRADTHLKVYAEQDGEFTVVTLVGPVDASTFDQYKDELDPVFKDGAPLIAVDCGSLSYINSKGIGLLASYHRMLLIKEGNMVLFGVNRRIMKTLDLLGLAKRLNICGTKRDAFSKLSEKKD